MDNEKDYLKKHIEKVLFETDIKRYNESQKKFMNETNHQDNLVIVLRAHIYIEQELFDLLRRIMKNPDKLRAKYYSDKLNLAYSLGLIEQYLYSSLNKLNDIRNKFAHGLGFEITEKELNELISPLSKEAKNEYEKNLIVYGSSKEKNFQLKLRILLAFLYSDVCISTLTAYKTFEERISDFNLLELYRVISIINDKDQTNTYK